jgi:hypothetical protein
MPHCYVGQVDRLIDFHDSRLLRLEQEFERDLMALEHEFEVSGNVYRLLRLLNGQRVKGHVTQWVKTVSGGTLLLPEYLTKAVSHQLT